MEKNGKPCKSGRAPFRRKFNLFGRRLSPGQPHSPRLSAFLYEATGCNELHIQSRASVSGKAGLIPRGPARGGFIPFFPVFFSLFFSSCQTTPPSYTAPSLTLKAKGAFFSSKGRIPWRAYIYLRERDRLRAEAVTPFGGTVFQLLAENRRVIFQFPLQKTYCELTSDRYKIPPDGPSLSIKDIYFLLRNGIPPEWSCSEKPPKKSLECALPGGKFRVFLKNRRRKKTIEVKEEGSVRLSFTVTPLSEKPLEDGVFSFDRSGLTRLPDCGK